MDLKSTYNKIAEDWYKDHHDDSWWIAATDKFISLLNPGDSVLDVGCGGGVKSNYLMNNGLKVVGIDFSEKMIEIAEREAPQGKFHVMDMYDLSGLSRKFDGIFVQAALLHIPKTKAPLVLAELITKLKTGGHLYIGVKELRPKESAEEILRESDYGYEFKRFFSYYTLDEIKKYLTDLNMSIPYENVMNAGKTNWVQVIAESSNIII